MGSKTLLILVAIGVLGILAVAALRLGYGGVIATVVAALVTLITGGGF